MGYGGYLVLMNGCGADLALTYINSYQMNSWNSNFPAKIDAFSSATVYIEYKEKIFSTWTDDAGDATYSFTTGNLGFKIHASFSSSDSGYLTTITSLGTSSSSVFHNGYTPVGIICSASAPTTVVMDSAANGADRWMQNSMDFIGSKTISEISILGSHDSGMSVLNEKTIPTTSCNAVTQFFNVAQQLLLGVRFFDLRPFIRNGVAYTAHFSDISTLDLGIQGGEGESLAEIISALSSFLSERNELIILDLSNANNGGFYTNDGSLSTTSDYIGFTENNYDTICQLLTDAGLPLINYSNVANLQLQALLSQGSAVIAILPDGKFTDSSCLSYSALNIYNEYSDVNNFKTMYNDQLAKMKANNNDRVFLLSDTLTQSGADAVGCDVDSSLSILSLGTTATESLFEFASSFTQTLFPNIVLIDAVESASSLFLSLYANALS
ncbi:hypothetical protein HK100_007367 [Physocladia obscura]|uniref:PLC-like phosphodiesterase n=1 Tax=Physocladia obscura TaxID=109957 RepID=A0AAD5T6I1_9FUNG|nr:hypothetical protein HK100_007367 [Physocladia obscura]